MKPMSNCPGIEAAGGRQGLQLGEYTAYRNAKVSDPIKSVLSVQSLRVEACTGGERRQLLVDDVSFDLGMGEVIGLIGESGAGKSTIGLAALGYERPGCRIASGRILFRGVDILGMPEHERQALRGGRVGYIAQSASASFNPASRILNQVCEVPIVKSMCTPHDARDRAIALFDELDLSNPNKFGNSFPHQVSGGQLQRAMAAMAMAPQPEILIFDEPTTALDVTTQVEVLAAFRNLIKNYGTAAIYISHDLAVVAQLADRIMVLRHGRMVELGKTLDVLERPRQDYTKRLIGKKSVNFSRSGEDREGEVVLSLRGVGASYRALANVVRDVTFEVVRGDTLAIVGESGSGKSTLARVITGLLPRDAGIMEFLGEQLPAALKHRTVKQLRSLQMIYQSPDVALNPQHTILETIGRPIKFYFNSSRGVIKDRVAELLEQIEMPVDFMQRRTSTLSGGQKQRLCIARALAANPGLIICDEITSALDQLVAEEILGLLRSLQDANKVAFLFITHDLGLVRRFSNRIIIMKKGVIVQHGDTETVFTPPHDDYTSLLMSSVPQMQPGWLDQALKARE
jgi:peptide/nickel transport system ATP-binding protein